MKDIALLLFSHQLTIDEAAIYLLSILGATTLILLCIFKKMLSYADEFLSMDSRSSGKR